MTASAANVQAGRLCRVEIGGPATDTETFVGLGSLSPAGFLATRSRDKLPIDAGPGGLRVKFHAEWNADQWSFNVGYVEVYGLNEDDRTWCSKAKNVAVLVGYDSGAPLELIALFQIHHVTSTHDGPEWVTKFEGGDGGTPQARTNKTFAPGTGLGDIAQYLMGQMGKVGASAKQSVQAAGSGRRQAKGYLAYGNPSRQLSAVLGELGLGFTMQFGEIIASKRGQPTQTVFFISPTAGLVGSPAPAGAPDPAKPQEWTIKVLLNPMLRARSKIVLQSAALKGNFYAQTVSHDGDTYGNDWYSKLNIRRLG